MPGPSEVGAGKWPEGEFVAHALRCYLLVAMPGIQHGGHVHPGFIANGGQSFVQVFAKIVDQKPSQLAVESSHPADVAFEVAFLNEVREDFLMEAGRAKIHHTARGDETVNHIQRNYEVTQPRRGEKDFAESPDINYAGIGIKTL